MTTSTFVRDRNTHRAAVINGAHSHRGDGTIGAVNPRLDLATLLSTTLAWFEPQCVIVLDDHDQAWVRGGEHEANIHGWRRQGDGPWYTFRRDSRTVMVGLRNFMLPARHFGVLFDETTDPGVLAMRLDRYQRATGTAWRGTPATTAHNAIRLSWENGRGTPLWHEPRVPGTHGVGFMHWTRNPTEVERSWGYQHRFDANAAYLGAAISAELPWGPLEPTGPRPFDPRVAGVWRIMPGAELVAWDANPNRPPLFGNRTPGRPHPLDGDGTTCVTTPYAKFLAELGAFDVVDSATATRASRILRQFGERIRDGRTIDAAAGWHIEAAVARTYKDAVGGMQRDGMPITRHVWGWTVIDQWRATLYRAILRVHTTQGVWPLAVATDSVTYADCTPTPTPSPDKRFPGLLDALGVASCELGCGCTPQHIHGRLGAWKHEESTETGETS